MPEQPFFLRAQERTALARERLFVEGQRPTGLVGEPIIQSWQRCLVAHRRPADKLAFEPVTASRRHGALQRSRPLLEAARPTLEHLQATLARTGVRSFLCDSEGLVVHSSPVPAEREPVLGLASRLGVNLGEDAVGTTAPGLVLRTGQAVLVRREEHFFDLCGHLSCAAAPIHDRHGRLAGVLDLSAEGHDFGFDAATLVSQCAGAIEDAVLALPDVDTLLLHFQADPRLLGTPLQAMAGIDTRGRVTWVNRQARSLLGSAEAVGEPAEEVFGHGLSVLMAQVSANHALPLPLPNGLTVWVRAQLQWVAEASTSTGEADAAPPALPTASGPAASAAVRLADEAADPLDPADRSAVRGAPTLAEHDHRLVLETLQRCGGNVSHAARELGVSRGLLYRRLAAAGARRGN